MRRGDTRKRHLQIDGPTRLIRLSESINEGPSRFKGTRVSLTLTRGAEEKGSPSKPPAWDQIWRYLEFVCLDLPYRLNLEHIDQDRVDKGTIDAQPPRAAVPAALESEALRIPVSDADSGLEGEIAIVTPSVLLPYQDGQRIQARAGATDRSGVPV